jgi:phosphoribosylamine---glycine ligase
MSRFLVFDKTGMSTSLAFRLSHLEDKDVRFFSQTAEGKEHLDGMVPKVRSLEEGLRWLGRDGYFVCGDEQDCTFLRKRGFRGYGGNRFIQALEDKRDFQSKVAQTYGLAIPNFHQVKTVREAVKFIKDKPDQYVLKQTGDLPKWFSFVGADEDGEDVIEQLLWMEQQPEFKKSKDAGFMLQEFVEGIELAVGAWWQYDHWMTDQEGNPVIVVGREHKKQGEKNTGVTCGEMGTVCRFVKKSRLFNEVLNKFTPALKKFAPDVCLYIDANCGVVEEDDETHKPRAYLYEITARSGYPCSTIYEFGMETPQAEFYKLLIENDTGMVAWKDEWLVGTVLGAGRFPFEFPVEESYGTFRGQPVTFPFNKWDEHFAPGYIRYDSKSELFRIADNYEDVGTVVYAGNDIIKANAQCVELMRKIVVRSPQMRLDIGEKFVKDEVGKLYKMGYIEKEDMPVMASGEKL